MTIPQGLQGSNMTQSDIIVYAIPHWLKKNINQSLNSQKTPYLYLAGELWGVYFEDLGDNWPRYNDTALYMFIVDFQPFPRWWAVVVGARHIPLMSPRMSASACVRLRFPMSSLSLPSAARPQKVKVGFDERFQCKESSQRWFIIRRSTII